MASTRFSRILLCVILGVVPIMLSTAANANSIAMAGLLFTAGGGAGGCGYSNPSGNLSFPFTIGSTTFTYLAFQSSGVECISESISESITDTGTLYFWDDTYSNGTFLISAGGIPLLSGTESLSGSGCDGCPGAYPGLDVAFGSLGIDWANPAFFGPGIASGTGTLSLAEGVGPLTISGQVTPVPEPASLLLISTGLIGMAGAFRRARQNSGKGT